MHKSIFRSGYVAPHAVIVKITVKQILCQSQIELPEEEEDPINPNQG